MPILAVFPIEFHAPNRLVQLVQKAKLSTHAKVRHCQKAKLLQDEFS